MRQIAELMLVANANQPTRRNRHRNNKAGQRVLPGARSEGRPPAGARPPRHPVVLSPARVHPPRPPAGPSAARSLPSAVCPLASHADLPPSGHIAGTFGGELSPNTRGGGGASVLAFPSGQVEISGGEYNAVAGNQINLVNRIEISVNGVREISPANVAILEPVPKKMEAAHDKGTLDIETARPEPSPSNRSNDDSQTWPATTLLQSSNDYSESIYYRSLAFKKRGSPLWIPEPNKQLPVEYQRNGLMICDTGIITDRGYFDPLYNIALPADQPLGINSDELPENFSHLPLKARDISKYSEFKQGSSIASESVKRLYQDNNSPDLVFESSALGAILTLPNQWGKFRGPRKQEQA